jgi:hypothetical protein
MESMKDLLKLYENKEGLVETNKLTVETKSVYKKIKDVKLYTDEDGIIVTKNDDYDDSFYELYELKMEQEFFGN